MSPNVPTFRLDETDTGEVLSALDEHGRVRLEGSGSDADAVVTHRKRDGQYYCDTLARLRTYDTAAGMTRCLRDIGVEVPSPTDCRAAADVREDGGRSRSGSRPARGTGSE